MRPVSADYPINQPFGSMKTAGVAANPSPASGVGYYVHLYGNYQPYGHAGCDIACPEGTPVRAMQAGTVLWADWGTKLPGDESNAGYRKRWYLYKGFPGIVTVIQHTGWVGVYAHLSAAWMNVGDKVTEGQQIGLSGGTGGVAPHLHVEALVDLNYTTGGGLIYGRTSPEPYFGGIAAMGTTTTSEEDDMGHVDTISDEAAEKIAEKLVGKQIKREGSEGTNTLGWSLGAEAVRTDGIISRTAQAAVAGVLFTKFPRQGEGQSGDTDLASVISWFDHGVQNAGSASAAATGPGIDPEQVAAAISAAVAEALKGISVTLTTEGH